MTTPNTQTAAQKKATEAATAKAAQAALQTRLNNLNIFSGNIMYIKSDEAGNAAPTVNGNEYMTVAIRYKNDQQVGLADGEGNPIFDAKGNIKPLPTQLYLPRGTVEELGLSVGDLVAFPATKLVAGDQTLADGDTLHKVRGLIAEQLTVVSRTSTEAATIVTGEASEGLQTAFSNLAKTLKGFLGGTK